MIGETVCVKGWTKTVRPPFSITNAIKLAKLRERGLTAAGKSRFELDHIIPLSLGGSPDDPRKTPVGRPRPIARLSLLSPRRSQARSRRPVAHGDAPEIMAALGMHFGDGTKREIALAESAA